MSPHERAIVREFLTALDTTYGPSLYAARKRVEELLEAPPPEPVRVVVAHEPAEPGTKPVVKPRGVECVVFQS